MKLLREWSKLDSSPDLVRESRAKNDGAVLLRGVFQRADAVNQNGRVYPSDVLQREVRNYQKLIGEKRSVGELDHPQESTVELQKVSHIVTALYLEGNDVMGELRLLNTPCGKIAQQLVEDGVTIGISSRGVGDTVKDSATGYDMVTDSFNLLCFDLVSDPSTAQAFLHESREIDRSYVDAFLTQADRIDRAANAIIEAHERQLRRAM